MGDVRHTPGPLTTAADNTVLLGLPMGGRDTFRIIWSEQTGRDVAYVLPPPVRTDDEGEAHAEPLDDAAELVRRWNAFPDLLAAAQRLVAAWDATGAVPPSAVARLGKAVESATGEST